MSMKAVLNAVSSAATESAAAPYKPQKIETFSKARNVERMDYSDFSENGESEPRPAATKKEKGEESILKARAEEYETEPKAKESEPLKEESAAEDKPWHADLKKDEVEVWKKSHSSYTQNAQTLAEERRKFLSEKEEFEKSRKAIEDEKYNSKMKDFKNLSLEERTEFLLESLSRNPNKDYADKKEIEALRAELHSLKAERFKDGIKSTLKKLEKDPDMEVKDEYLYKVNEAYFKLTGKHIENEEQFIFAHNSFKNQFSDEMIKRAKNEGIKEGRKEVEEGIRRVEITNKGHQKAEQERAIHEMTLEERRSAMLADPDVMKAGHYKFEMRRRK